MSEVRPWTLGQDSERHSLADFDAHCQALDTLLPQGRRTLRIFAPTLDIELLNREPVTSAVAALVRVSPLTRIRILLTDSSPAVRSGHRLITLSQRFPSFMEIRKRDQWDARCPAWLVLDEQATLWRPDFNRYSDGIACCHEPGQAGKLCRDFDEMWEQSSQDPDLRRLTL